MMVFWGYKRCSGSCLRFDPISTSILAVSFSSEDVVGSSWLTAEVENKDLRIKVQDEKILENESMRIRNVGKFADSSSVSSFPWLPAWGPLSMFYHQSKEKRFETLKKVL